MTYRTIADIKLANKAAGHFFFSKETLDWFSSIVEPGVYGGRYFVTSERDESGIVWGGKRRWSVRRANDDGTIDTVGEFGGFASKARATQAARTYATTQEA